SHSTSVHRPDKLRGFPPPARLAASIVLAPEPGAPCSAARAGADLLELAEEQVDLLGLRVEVRGDADPGAGPVIAEELAAVELAADVGRADEVEDDGAAAPLGLARAVELHAELV